MYGYSGADLGKNIKLETFKTETINQVFLNSTKKNKCLTYKSTDGFEKEHDSPIKNMEYVVLKGKTPKKKTPWSVSIIAGHVPKDLKIKEDKSTPDNSMSLVTLLEVGGHKALFLGDATLSTEAFLINHQSKFIKNVDFVHVPHHGSTSSSGQQFVNLVKPKQGAQVTNQTAESGYRLPREPVIKRWLKVLPDIDDDHPYDYWEKKQSTEVNAELAKWRKTYKNHLDVIIQAGPNKFYLQIDEIDEDFTGCYYLCWERMLFRESGTKPLWETGATGMRDWFVPEE